MNAAFEPYPPHPYAQWDAAYVLGALSPAERREFEEHRATCADCQKAVSELAGMPGLLAKVPSDIALLPPGEPTAEEETPPATLMPAMITDLRTRRRRITRALVGVAAALVLLVGVTAILGVRGVLPVGGTSGPFRVAFTAVAPSGMTAVADVVPLDQGTAIRLECQYGEVNEPKPGGAYAQYAIYVIDRSGHASLAKTWTAKPNKQMRPEAVTPLRVNQIARVEIKDVSEGQTVLQAALR